MPVRVNEINIGAGDGQGRYFRRKLNLPHIDRNPAVRQQLLQLLQQERMRRKQADPETVLWRRVAHLLISFFARVKLFLPRASSKLQTLSWDIEDLPVRFPFFLRDHR